jgi:hypothetical protein
MLFKENKMAVPQAVAIGLFGNEISKKIAGTSEVSAGRTAVATGTGAALGAVASGALVISGAAAAAAAAPVVVSLATAGAVVSFVASLFD